MKEHTSSFDKGVKGSRWKGLGRRNDLTSSMSTPQIVAIDRYIPEVDVTGVIDEIRSNSSNESNERQQQQQQLVNGKQEQLTGALIIQMSYASSSSTNAALLSRLFTLEDVGSDDPMSAGQRLWLHATKSVVDMHGGNITAFPLPDRVPGGAATGISFIIELPMTRIVDVSNASGSNSVVQSSLPSSTPTGDAQGLGLAHNGQWLELGPDHLPLLQPLQGTRMNAHSNLNHHLTLPVNYNNNSSQSHTNNHNNCNNNDRCTSEVDRVSILSPSDVMSSITLPPEVCECSVVCPV